MTCPSCEAATQNPASGLLNAGCSSCDARSLAKSPAWSEARAANAMTPGYRNALRTVFGEHWRDGHEQVKGWDAILKGQQ
jgi:hypothetical protein